MKKVEKKVKTTIVDDLSWIKTTIPELEALPEKVRVLITEYLSYFTLLSNLDNKDSLTFSNVIHKKEEMSFKISKLAATAHVFEMLHVDEPARQAAQKAGLEVSKMLNELSYNETLFKVFSDYYNLNFKKEKKNLTKEEVYIVEEAQKSYRKMGMYLPKNDRKKLVNISNKSDELTQAFSIDIVKSEEKGLWFKQEDLEGLPTSVLGSFRQEGDKYFIQNRTSDVSQVRKLAVSREVRQLVTEMASCGPGEANLKRMKQALALRRDATKILGYKTFVELATDEQLISGEKNIRTFITDLKKKLSDPYKVQLDYYKKSLAGEPLDSASVWYAEAIYAKARSGVDQERLKEYFEVESTVNAMWKLWEDLFDLKVTKIKTQNLFHRDSSVYEVKDKTSGEVKSVVVLDLFPREGKYGHACVYSPLPRWQDMSGKVNVPVCFLICNFSKSKTGPTLLDMYSIATLFHEGGHLLHGVLGSNTYLSTAWNGVSTDFVEIPSQVFEKFGSTSFGLGYIGKHFKTGRKVPSELLAPLDFVSRDTLFMWFRQFAFSLLDMDLHGKKSSDNSVSTKKMSDIYSGVVEGTTKVKFTKKPGALSNFGHLMGGYESRYYSYVVSKVYSEDLWQVMKKSLSVGMKKNKTTGKYKQMLSAASTKKESELLKEFLGRQPKDEAFIKNITQK